MMGKHGHNPRQVSITMQKIKNKAVVGSKRVFGQSVPSLLAALHPLRILRDRVDLFHSLATPLNLLDLVSTFPFSETQ